MDSPPTLGINYRFSNVIILPLFFFFFPLSFFFSSFFSSFFWGEGPNYQRERPRLGPTGTVMTGIFSALDRMARLKPNVCCVESPMSGLLSAVVFFMTWKSQASERSRRSGG